MFFEFKTIHYKSLSTILPSPDTDLLVSSVSVMLIYEYSCLLTKLYLFELSALSNDILAEIGEPVLDPFEEIVDGKLSLFSRIR